MIGRPVRNGSSPVPRRFVEPPEVGIDVQVAQVGYEPGDLNRAVQRGDDPHRADVGQFHDQRVVVYGVDVGGDRISPGRVGVGAKPPDPHHELPVIALGEPDLARFDHGRWVGGQEFEGLVRNRPRWHGEGGRFEARVADLDPVEAYAAVQAISQMAFDIRPAGGVVFSEDLLEEVGIGRVVGPLAHHVRLDLQLLNLVRPVLQLLTGSLNHLYANCNLSLITSVYM